MADFPALPLFTDAVIADCYHLTDEEFGRYVRLLMLMWRSPSCRVPVDPVWISKRLNTDALAYAKHIQPIVHEFCTEVEENGEKWWIQKRLRKEYAYVRELSEKRRKAANKRWDKEKDVEKQQKNPMQSTSKAHAPTPTPTPILEIYIDGHCHNENSFFEIFWNEYPSFRPKGNRDTARKRFEPVFKQIAKGNINNETFIRRVREYKNFCEQGGNYNQHASTWLYQKGWDTDWASQESKAPNKPRSGNSDGKGSGRIDKVITAAEKAKQGLGSV